MTRTKHEVVTKTLSAAVASGGSFTVAYPEGRTPEDFSGGTDHQIITNTYMPVFAARGEFSIAFGDSQMTVTINKNLSLANGTVVYLHLDRSEPTAFDTVADPDNMSVMDLVKINLGAPDASDGDGAAVAQAVASAGNMTLNGALASGGVATFDVPRNVIAVSTGAGDTTQTLTVTGTDNFGETVVEQISLNGTTSVQGKKAFKTVTQIAVSAACAGNISAGTSKTLGLPIFVADAPDVLAEIEDGATATAGTIVAADITTPAATTGDVRGTYRPNSNPDGSKVFELTAAVRAVGYKGAAQYTG